RRGDIASPSAEAGKAGDPTLLAALRAWRSQTARSRGVPDYVVLHDSTIDGIASARPKSLNELRGIARTGEMKAHVHGGDVTALVVAAVRSWACAGFPAPPPASEGSGGEGSG